MNVAEVLKQNMSDSDAAEILMRRAKSLDAVMDAVEIEAVRRAVDALTGDDLTRSGKRENAAKRALTEHIVEFLNVACGTHYKANTKATREVISARISEGYVEQDFMDVITFKAKEWKGTKWEPYLRPITLFGSKFESYLENARKEKPKVEKTVTDNKESDEAERVITDEEWLRMMENSDGQ